MIHYDTHSCLPTRYMVGLRGPFLVIWAEDRKDLWYHFLSAVRP